MTGVEVIPTIVRTEDPEILRDSAEAERRQAIRYASRRYVAIPQLQMEMASQYTGLALRIGALGLEGEDTEAVLGLTLEESSVLDSARVEAARRKAHADSWLGKLQRVFTR